MSKSFHSRRPSDPEVPVLGQDGRNPPPGRRPRDGFTEKTKDMRESTAYGILLFFLNNTFDWPLSTGQRLWIVYRARKLSLPELLRAGQYSDLLISDEAVKQRMFRRIREIYFAVPSLDPKQIPEKRTIGIGYRDKGSLRPLHQTRTIGEEVFWDEDIAFLLPFGHEIEGKWITAEEVESLVGRDLLILAIQQIQRQTFRSDQLYPFGRKS